MRQYTLEDVTQVGEDYFIDTQHGVMRGPSAEGLVRWANDLTKAKHRPAFFLEAWKDAVELAGEQFFDIRSTSIDAATDKNELAPSMAAIANGIGGLNGGEKQFLLAIYQFYDDQALYAFCLEQDVKVPSLSDLALLDDEHRQVLTQLLHSYGGWLPSPGSMNSGVRAR